MLKNSALKVILWLSAIICHTMLQFALFYSLINSTPIIALPLIAIIPTLLLVHLNKRITKKKEIPHILIAIVGMTITCVLSANITILVLKTNGNSETLHMIGCAISILDLIIVGVYTYVCWNMKEAKSLPMEIKRIDVYDIV